MNLRESEGPGGALIPGCLFIREAETLEIPANKLGNGKRYTVRHLHFGHSAEAQFVAVREPKPPAKKAVKKKAKKATKKKAVKKKARKTAKKKAAKRKK